MFTAYSLKLPYLKIKIPCVTSEGLFSLNHYTWFRPISKHIISYTRRCHEMNSVEFQSSEFLRQNHLVIVVYLKAAILWSSWGHCNLHKPCRTHKWWTLGCGSSQCPRFWTADQSHRLGLSHQQPTSDQNIAVKAFTIYINAKYT